MDPSTRYPSRTPQVGPDRRLEDEIESYLESFVWPSEDRSEARQLLRRAMVALRGMRERVEDYADEVAILHRTGHNRNPLAEKLEELEGRVFSLETGMSGPRRRA